MGAISAVDRIDELDVAFADPRRYRCERGSRHGPGSELGAPHREHGMRKQARE
jgi:hypothetical protein